MPDESRGHEPRSEITARDVAEFIRQLGSAERTLQSLGAGEIDAVLEPMAAVPVLLTKAQEALLRSELRYRDLVERCPSLVVELAADGTTILVNAATERVLGVRMRDVAGRRWWTELVPENWRAEAAAIADEVRRGDIAGRQLPLMASDGTLRWVEWTSANRRASDGELGAIVLFGLDVTERRAAEQASQRLAAERLARTTAEAANRAKSEFLTTMSHELRTPLNAIVGYSQLMEMQLAGPLSEAQRQYLLRIKATSAHLTMMVSEVLDLAKAEAGQLVVAPVKAMAGQVVSAAIALVAPQARDRGVAVVHRCEGDGDLAYIGDEARVRQILVNLVSNAIKFTPEGGEVLMQCMRTDGHAPGAPLFTGGPWMAIRVRDTGIGIPADKIADVFEPFVQLDAGHTRKEGGTGLGLTISRRLARLMGGDVSAESTTGVGSTFTLWLPGERHVSDAGGSSSAEALVHSTRMRLAAIGSALARQAERVAEAVVRRLRADSATPTGHGLREVELRDYFAILVADLANSIRNLAEQGGEDLNAIREGTEVRRLIAARHGSNRAGLGWTEATLERECEILREELDTAARRAASEAGAELAEALGVIGLVTEQVERLSLQALRSAIGAE